LLIKILAKSIIKVTKQAKLQKVKKNIYNDIVVGQLRGGGGGGGGVNQLLLCLNNYAHFKLFTWNTQ
jgi:hypothetical protein